MTIDLSTKSWRDIDFEMHNVHFTFNSPVFDRMNPELIPNKRNRYLMEYVHKAITEMISGESNYAHLNERYYIFHEGWAINIFDVPQYVKSHDLTGLEKWEMPIEKISFLDVIFWWESHPCRLRDHMIKTIDESSLVDSLIDALIAWIDYRSLIDILRIPEIQFIERNDYLNSNVDWNGWKEFIESREQDAASLAIQNRINSNRECLKDAIDELCGDDLEAIRAVVERMEDLRGIG